MGPDRVGRHPSYCAGMRYFGSSIFNIRGIRGHIVTCTSQHLPEHQPTNRLFVRDCRAPLFFMSAPNTETDSQKLRKAIPGIHNGLREEGHTERWSNYQVKY